MRWTCAVVLLAGVAGFAGSAVGADADVVDMPAEVLADKIAGGLLGQLLGNLNGLPHEMKYIDEPGEVAVYTPGLPDGAWTDDDTDIEWVYLVEMQRSGEVLISAERIVELWRRHLNHRIWCANLYARGLMDLGMKPPWTGRLHLNPWSSFNIGGQFLSEAFGLIAPGMPRTASTIGLHYTHVAIDGEPAQTTQLFASMIATAFVSDDLHEIIKAGCSAVDPGSELHGVIEDVQEWWRAEPGSWQDTRRRIRDKYTRHSGDLVDRNGYPLNTAATVGALLYGGGDFTETVRLAFNFGWDADNNAATTATILGVVKGQRWMQAQGWTIVDRYENRSRPGMPTDETITRYAGRLTEIARSVILANGGREVDEAGRTSFRIRLQKAANVEPLVSPRDRRAELRRRLLPQVEKDLSGDAEAQARAAYIALCLGEGPRLKAERSEVWEQAIAELRSHPHIVQNILKAPGPDAAALRQRAEAVELLPGQVK